MRLTREVKFGLWAVVAIGAALAAFLVGGMLKPEEPPYYVFDLDAPAYGSDLEALAAMSPGGFTGFEDLIPGGSRTVLGGRIVELSGEDMTLETPAGAKTQLRLLDTPRLTRLESGGRELLQAGVSVIVKLGETEGEAAAVLIVSPQP
ncbi:MAG TPA: hypothetical protein VFS30_14600 [Dehalococcoidia bacterium]|nr:hypothetical protein [Dehalococcoidia bacterium]